MKYLKFTKWLLLITFLIGFVRLNAQDPQRFSKEIEVLTDKDYNFSKDKDLLLFTGSSSVRMWKNIQSDFPGYNVVNNGFGGSHFSDLIHYYDKLIAPYKPDVLLIYEGDNDVASGKKQKAILKDAKQLVGMIRNDLPETKIVLISPKPSIARWELRKEYQKMNRLLEKFANRSENVEFADVWEASVDEKGNVYRDIFVDDNLHLNEKGYDIWKEVMTNHLD